MLYLAFLATEIRQLSYRLGAPSCICFWLFNETRLYLEATQDPRSAFPCRLRLKRVDLQFCCSWCRSCVRCSAESTSTSAGAMRPELAELMIWLIVPLTTTAWESIVGYISPISPLNPKGIWESNKGICLISWGSLKRIQGRQGDIWSK